MKTQIPESLVKRKTLPNGRILGVHAWATGYQSLDFDNQEHFDQFRESIGRRNATILAKLEGQP